MEEAVAAITRMSMRHELSRSVRIHTSLSPTPEGELASAALSPMRPLHVFEAGGVPPPVKTEASKKRGPCSCPRCARSPARTTPRFLVLTANPPLIGAGLVGCMRNPKARKDSQ